MIKDKLKNITIFQTLILGVLVFMAYATVDILLKLNENRKYNREAILLEIQKDYPYSKLNFQNFKIVDNSLKVGGKHNNTHYYESAYFYIKDKKLNKEANYIYLFYTLLPILFLTIFHQDPRTIRVRDLNKLSFSTYSWIFGSILLVVFFTIFSSTNSDKYYANDFNDQAIRILSEVNLNNYRIKK